MNLAVTLRGIDQAIANLNYKNENALKCRLVSAIRAFYGDEPSAGSSLQGIEPERLIGVLWEVADDPEAQRSKKKNLSSVKSSVNADLKRLYGEGKNPEGIIVGPENLFVISDEAKDSLLESFKNKTLDTGSASFGEMREILTILNEVISSRLAGLHGVKDGEAGDFNQIKDLLQALSATVGLNQGGMAGVSNSPPGSLSQELEVRKEEVLEPEPEEEILDVEMEEVPDAVEPEEETESPEPEEDLVDVDVAEEILPDSEVEGCPSADGSEIEGEGGPQESSGQAGLSLGGLGDDGLPDDTGKNDERFRAKLLAERFNNSLAAIDRYYNQHILIPEGEYAVGSPGPRPNEMPQRLVRLQAVYMARFPVTNALFELFVEKTGYRTTAEKRGYGTVYYGRYQKKKDDQTGLETLSWNSALVNRNVAGACWYQPLGPGSNLHQKRNHPVVQVSLEDALAFSAWTGKRLPSEEEWEAASRTAKGYLFPWGNVFKEGTCNIEGSFVADTTPVDKYMEFENEFGIVDTFGNVLEWTAQNSGAPRAVTSKAGHCVGKGGSWVSGNGICLCSRFELDRQSHSNILGFRCVAH